MIVVQHNEQDDLSIDLNQVEHLVKAVLSYKKVPPCEVILHFISVPKICELHKDHFNDPTPTDCITFPIDSLDQPDPILGEVFICPQVAKEYTPDAPYRELSLYIVHTLLHLLGFDDIDPKERSRMRRAERTLMKMLSEKNLVLSNPSMAIKKL